DRDQQDPDEPEHDDGHGAAELIRRAGGLGSDVLPGGTQPPDRTACGRDRLGVVVALVATARLAGPLDVDVAGELGRLGEDRYAPLGDRQETAAGGDDDVLTGLGADRDHATL